MATQILATGTTALDSSDVVIASPTTIGLKGTLDAASKVVISLKDDAAAYNPVEELSQRNSAVLITAPGTYRFTRVAGGNCGVYSA